VISGIPISVAKINLPEWLGRDLPVTMYGAIGPDRGFIENWSYFLDGLGGLDLEAYRTDVLEEVEIRPRSQCFVLMDNTQERQITQAADADGCAVTSYPNPVTAGENWVIVRTSCNEFFPGYFTLRIYDHLGREAVGRRTLRGIPNSFPVINLPGGRYFAVLTGGGNRFTFSFLKTP